MRTAYRIITADDKWQKENADEVNRGHAVTVEEIIARIRGTKHLQRVILETAEDEPPQGG